MTDSNHTHGYSPSNGIDKTQGTAPNGPTPFDWPVPPFAIYAKTVPTNTPVPCEVEGLNGVVRRGLLVSMAPQEQAIWIKTAEDKSAISLAFSKFRRLTLSDELQPQLLSKTENHRELLQFRQPVKFSLELDNGQRLQGKTVGYDETAYGLFLFPPVDDDGAVQRVFIPSKAFINLKIGEPIGQVLVDQKVLEPDMVAQAVEYQVEQRNRKLGEYLVHAMVVTQDELLAAIEQQAKMPMVRLGEALVRLGYVEKSQLEEALELQKVDRSQPLGKLLISMGFLTAAQLTNALARKMGYPMVDVLRFPLQEEALLKVPRHVAKRLGVLPLLVRQGLLVVAASDPTRNSVLDELGFMIQGRVVAALADDEDIQETIESGYAKLGWADSQEYETLDDLEKAVKGLTSGTELLETMQAFDGPDEPEDEPIAQSDNTLVRLINTMIIEAFAQQVSDIHIETQPHRSKVRIRFRRDGVLSPYLELPHNYRAALVARLKIMASLDISERRKPQDGKIDFRRFSPRHRLELRIATIPTMNGLEDVVMRLLSSAKPIVLDKLGLTPDNNVHLRHAINRPYGMVLCAGPTGSGKTTTLHSILGQLSTSERKIWTAEDPVEITQPELRQVQVNPRIGWTFAQALRSFLRADPDIIMVGEIRDAETAHMAIEASLTGHLLLSTLHTNNAAETVTRLIDMGMDPFNFADSLLAVLAQRLVRRWCVQCRVSKPASAEYLQELMDDYRHAFPETHRPSEDKVMKQWLSRFAVDGQLHHYHAPGCEHCHGTGLTGRMGLHELLQVSPGIRRLIQTSAPAERILEEAFQSGWFRTLRQDGIVKVLEGHISIEEVRANSNA